MSRRKAKTERFFVHCMASVCVVGKVWFLWSVCPKWDMESRKCHWDEGRKPIRNWAIWVFVYSQLSDNRIKITHIRRSCYFLSWHICPFCSSPSPPCMLSNCRCYRWHILSGKRGTPFSSYHRNNHRSSCWDIFLREKIDSAYIECTATPRTHCRRNKMNGNRHNCIDEWKWHFNYSIEIDWVLESKLKFSIPVNDTRNH